MSRSRCVSLSAPVLFVLSVTCVNGAVRVCCVLTARVRHPSGPAKSELRCSDISIILSVDRPGPFVYCRKKRFETVSGLCVHKQEKRSSMLHVRFPFFPFRFLHFHLSLLMFTFPGCQVPGFYFPVYGFSFSNFPISDFPCFYFFEFYIPTQKKLLSPRGQMWSHFGFRPA